MRHTRPLSLLLACFMVFSLFGCAKKAETAVLTWEQQYELGLHYLSEGNYKEAIIAFTSAIEIDPKRVETYRALADVYMELGDTENAFSILESGYAATEDESLLDYLDSLNTPEEQGPTDGVTPFESRKWYQEASTLTAEQTAFLNNMIAAVQNEDMGSLTAMAPDFYALFERENGGGFTFSSLITKTDEYKVYAEIRQNSPTNRWLTISIRPENGTGYYASVHPEAWLDADQMDYEPWSYAAVDCVNWQAEGSFRRSALEYHYSDVGTYVETASETGTAAGGVMLESTNTTVMTNQTNGEVNEFTRERSYENGHLLLSDGPDESLWTPFSGPGSTNPDPEWIFW